MKTLGKTTGIAAKDKALLSEIKGVVQAFLPKATLLVYGSAARGTRGPDSDYDILVLTTGPLPRDKESVVESAVYDLQRARGAVIATMYYSKEQWDSPLHRAMPFHQEVEKDAILL